MFTFQIFQPGGGQVKIAVRKLEWKAVSKTDASNEKYQDKKVQYTLFIKEPWSMNTLYFPVTINKLQAFLFLNIKTNFYFRVMNQKIQRRNQVKPKWIWNHVNFTLFCLQCEPLKDSTTVLVLVEQQRHDFNHKIWKYFNLYFTGSKGTSKLIWVIFHNLFSTLYT